MGDSLPDLGFFHILLVVDWLLVRYSKLPKLLPYMIWLSSMKSGFYYLVQELPPYLEFLPPFLSGSSSLTVIIEELTSLLWSMEVLLLALLDKSIESSKSMDEFSILL